MAISAPTGTVAVHSADSFAVELVSLSIQNDYDYVITYGGPMAHVSAHSVWFDALSMYKLSS